MFFGDIVTGVETFLVELRCHVTEAGWHIQVVVAVVLLACTFRPL